MKQTLLSAAPRTKAGVRATLTAHRAADQIPAVIYGQEKQPVTIVVVVFSIIQTFADFQLIYVLTGGGPANSTHLVATYAYQVGVAAGLLGEGAAISLFMFPVLLVVVWVQLRYLRRLEGA